jgi:cutinase
MILPYYCSQGAAVMHSAVAALPDEVKKATIGGVLFGSTKNKQEDAKIRDYPKDQVMSFCVEDDGVCWGRLDVTAGELNARLAFPLFDLHLLIDGIIGHLAYLTNGDGVKAANFLQGKIDQALKGKGA